MDDATTPICKDKVTVGLDLGDKYTHICVLDSDGEVCEESRLRTTPMALRRRFAPMPRARMVLEAGAHSPWISRLLNRLLKRSSPQPSIHPLSLSLCGPI